MKKVIKAYVNGPMVVKDLIAVDCGEPNCKGDHPTQMACPECYEKTGKDQPIIPIALSKIGIISFRCYRCDQVVCTVQVAKEISPEAQAAIDKIGPEVTH